MQRELPRGRKREILDRESDGRFRPNNTGGRPPGTPNKVSRTLRECVLMAGEIVGSDGKGRDGLLDYLVRIARRDPKTFCGLLGRLLPVDLHTKAEEPERTFRTIEEVRAEMLQRGMSADYVDHLADIIDDPSKANGGGSLN